MRALLLALALALSITAPSFAGWSCSTCTGMKDDNGKHVRASYNLYYNGSFHSKVDYTTIGQCLLGQNVSGKCPRKDYKFSCGPGYCSSGGNYCFYDQLYGGNQYKRVEFDSKGRMLEARDSDAYCKK